MMQYENIMSDAGLSNVSHTIQNHNTTVLIPLLLHFPLLIPRPIGAPLAYTGDRTCLPSIRPVPLRVMAFSA